VPSPVGVSDTVGTLNESVRVVMAAL
jgi:hypothetical protein